MSRTFSLVPLALGQGQERIIYGELSMAQPAPLTFSDPMFVVFPDFTTDYFVTITDWPALHGGTLPKQGAACMIVIDNQGSMRCVWWQGDQSSGGSTPSGPAGGDLAGSYPNPTITAALRSLITGSEQSANKGAASGYAPLDGSSLVPVANLPSLTLAKTPLTTKGDLLSVAAGVLARLGVGSDGQVLLADSTQTSGLRWGSTGSTTPSGPAGGDLGGSYPNPTVNQATNLFTALSGIAVSTGQLVTFGSDLQLSRLASGILQLQGVGAATRSQLRIHRVAGQSSVDELLRIEDDSGGTLAQVTPAGTITGAKMRIGNYGDPALFTSVDLSPVITDHSQSEYYAVSATPSWGPTNDVAKNFYGMLLEANLVDNAAVGNLTGSYYGVRGRIVNRLTTRQAANLVGGLFFNYNLNGAPVVNAYAAQVGNRSDGGSVVNEYGLYCLSPTGTGVVTNLYGVYIENQALGTTLNYALYSAGGQAFLNAGGKFVTPLVTKGVVGQAVDLQQWQDTTGRVMLRVENDGTIESSFATQVGSRSLTFDPGGLGLTFAADGSGLTINGCLPSGQVLISDGDGGSTWSSGGTPSGPAGGDLAGSYPNPTLGTLTRATAGTNAYVTQVTGEATPRFALDADGTLEWGDGTAARDVTLSRVAGPTLSVSKGLSVSGQGTGSLGFTSPFNRVNSFGGSTQANVVLYVNASNASNVALRVDGASSQSVNIFEVRDSAPTTWVAVASDGTLALRPAGTIGQSAVLTLGGGRARLRYDGPTSSVVLDDSGTGKPLYLQNAHPSQGVIAMALSRGVPNLVAQSSSGNPTGDLFQGQDSGGNVKIRVASDGTLESSFATQVGSRALTFDAGGLGLTFAADGSGLTIGPSALAGGSTNVLVADGDGASTWAAVSSLSGVAPTGAAGGDLSGTYPNPTVARGSGTIASETPAVAGVYLGTLAGTQRVIIADGSGTRALEIDNGGAGTGGGFRFFKPGTVLASLSGDGDYTVTRDVIVGRDVSAARNASAVTKMTAPLFDGQASTVVQVGSRSLTFDPGGAGLTFAADGSGLTIGPGALAGAGTNVLVADGDGASTWVLASSLSAGSSTPTGPAGGDLAGTYPNPTIKASVGLTGTPTTPTAAPGTNTTQIASTAFVTAAVPTSLPPSGAASGDLAGTYPSPTIKASVGLTGTPTTPTAAADTNTTQIASTAFVIGQATSATPLVNGIAAVGSSLRYARGDHVHPTDLTRAPLDSPAFTGIPTAPTAPLGTNTGQVASTAFVQSAQVSESVQVGSRSLTFDPGGLGLTFAADGSGLTIGPGALAGGSTNVLVADGDGASTWVAASTLSGVTSTPSGAAGGDLAGTYPNPTIKASVGLTGTPTAPTATLGTNTTQIASTAFVQAALPTSLPPSGAASGDLAGTYPSPTIKASVGLTGTPTAPTAVGGTNTTQIATTAFVTAGFVASGATAGGDLAGTYPNPTIKASVGLTGTPTAPTAVAGTSTTQIATTAFVTSGFVASGATAGGDLAGTYPNPTIKASVGLTGSPTAPTAAPATNTTQIATTAFVQAALPTSLPPNGAAGGDLSSTYPNPTVAKTSAASFAAAGDVIAVGRVKGAYFDGQASFAVQVGSRSLTFDPGGLGLTFAADGTGLTIGPSALTGGAKNVLVADGDGASTWVAASTLSGVVASPSSAQTAIVLSATFDAGGLGVSFTSQSPQGKYLASDGAAGVEFTDGPTRQEFDQLKGRVDQPAAVVASTSYGTLWAPYGHGIETIPRVSAGSGALSIVSGQMRATGIAVVPAGQRITQVTFGTSTTALATATHQWFALYDQGFNLLAVTSDDLSNAWAASTLKTLPLATPYTPTVDTPVYVAVMIAATTVPTFFGVGITTVSLSVRPPVGFNDTVHTGLTTPATAPAVAVAAADANPLYAYLT